MGYIQYHTHSEPLKVVADQYNFDSNFTYEVCRHNNIELNSMIIESINNTLPNWKTRPTLEIIDSRLKANSFVIYQFYKNEICGWFWLNPNFTHDWVNVKPLKPNSIYVGGMYKMLDKELPKNTAKDFGNYIMWYGAYNYDFVYAIIEDWNKASIQIFAPYNKFRTTESFI